MVRLLCLIVWILPQIISAQQLSSKAVQWAEGLTWDQLKAKAKQERKFLFVDCFTTWCAPCKKMDKEVYTAPEVISVMNDHFIAIKLQMDSTKNEGLPDKQRFEITTEISSKYKILGYPAFLFFDSDGQLVHQDLGYKDKADFISLMNTALDPRTQDVRILQEFNEGNKQPAIVLRAANILKKSGQATLADSIARFFKFQYLDKLNNDSLFTKDNIQFVANDFYFLIYEDGSKGKFFTYFLESPKKVDSIFGQGFAEFYVKQIITIEELNAKLIKGENAINKNPNWDSLHQIIAQRYSVGLANEIIADYEPSFYLFTKDWKKWASLFDQKIYGARLVKGGHYLGSFGDDWILNDHAWTTFRVCNDKDVLSRALQWVALAIKLKGNEKGVEQYYDTQANLLYKLGHKKKAIKIERKALQFATRFSKQKDMDAASEIEIFNNTVRKMKNGSKTW